MQFDLRQGREVPVDHLAEHLGLLRMASDKRVDQRRPLGSDGRRNTQACSDQQELMLVAEPVARAEAVLRLDR
jgi:hypothetical protein